MSTNADDLMNEINNWSPASSSQGASTQNAPYTYTTMTPEALYARNSPYTDTSQAPYRTQLDPAMEQRFQNWIADSHIPFDNGPSSDYDMRGYFKDVASKGKDEQSINPNDNLPHFPDTYKTPFHESFSADSQYALPEKAPRWNDKDQLTDRAGNVIFDERAKAKAHARGQSANADDLMNEINNWSPPAGTSSNPLAGFISNTGNAIGQALGGAAQTAGQAGRELLQNPAGSIGSAIAGAPAAPIGLLEDVANSTVVPALRGLGQQVQPIQPRENYLQDIQQAMGPNYQPASAQVGQFAGGMALPGVGGAVGAAVKGAIPRAALQGALTAGGYGTLGAVGQQVQQGQQYNPLKALLDAGVPMAVIGTLLGGAGAAGSRAIQGRLPQVFDPATRQAQLQRDLRGYIDQQNPQPTPATPAAPPGPLTYEQALADAHAQLARGVTPEQLLQGENPPTPPETPPPTAPTTPQIPQTIGEARANTALHAAPGKAGLMPGRMYIAWLKPDGTVGAKGAYRTTGDPLPRAVREAMEQQQQTPETQPTPTEQGPTLQAETPQEAPVQPGTLQGRVEENVQQPQSLMGQITDAIAPEHIPYEPPISTTPNGRAPTRASLGAVLNKLQGPFPPDAPGPYLPPATPLPNEGKPEALSQAISGERPTVRDTNYERAKYFQDAVPLDQAPPKLQQELASVPKDGTESYLDSATHAYLNAEHLRADFVEACKHVYKEDLPTQVNLHPVIVDKLREVAQQMGGHMTYVNRGFSRMATQEPIVGHPIPPHFAHDPVLAMEYTFELADRLKQAMHLAKAQRMGMEAILDNSLGKNPATYSYTYEGRPMALKWRVEKLHPNDLPEQAGLAATFSKEKFDSNTKEALEKGYAQKIQEAQQKYGVKGPADAKTLLQFVEAKANAYDAEFKEIIEGLGPDSETLQRSGLSPRQRSLVQKAQKGAPEEPPPTPPKRPRSLGRSQKGAALFPTLPQKIAKAQSQTSAQNAKIIGTIFKELKAKIPDVIHSMKYWSGLTYDMDLLRRVDPELHSVMQGFRGELEQVQKGVQPFESLAQQQAIMVARRLPTPRDIMYNQALDVLSHEQRQLLFDQRMIADDMADALKARYDTLKATDPTTAKLVRGVFEANIHKELVDTVKKIKATKYKPARVKIGSFSTSKESTKFEDWLQQARTGFYDAIVSGNYNIHELHVNEAFIQGTGYLGLDFYRGLHGYLTNPEVRSFVGDFKSAGMMRSLRYTDANKLTPWDKHVGLRVERFLEQHPDVQKFVKGARYTEGSWLEQAKLGALRAGLLEQIGKDMGIGDVATLAHALNHDTLSPDQQAEVYVRMTEGLFDMTGYSPAGFTNRNFLQRTPGKIGSILQPFMAMRTVQSRLLAKFADDAINGATPQIRYRGRRGLFFMHAGLLMVGGRATLPRLAAYGLGAAIGQEHLDDVEKYLDSLAVIPQATTTLGKATGTGITGRYQEELRPDMAPSAFIQLNGLNELLQTIPDATGAVKRLAKGEGRLGDVGKLATAAGTIVGGSSVAGLPSLYSAAKFGRKQAEAGEGEATRQVYDKVPFIENVSGEKSIGKYTIPVSSFQALMDYFGSGKNTNEYQEIQDVTTTHRFKEAAKQ